MSLFCRYGVAGRHMLLSTVYKWDTGAQKQSNALSDITKLMRLKKNTETGLGLGSWLSGLAHPFPLHYKF